MAGVEKKEEGVVLDVLERQWVRKSLETQRAVIVRGRNKELPGSDIWTLRGKEMDILTNLISKFG